jgi:hypothetical protein
MRIISCSILLIAALYGQWWPPAVNLGIPGFDDINPQACRNQSSHLCLVWQSHINGNWDIFSRYIINNTAWSDTVRVTSAPAEDCNPSVAFDPNRNCFWCVWQNDSGGFWNILVSQGSVTGQWTPPVPLTSDTFPDVSPSVCVIGSNVWVAWQRDTAGQATNIYSEFYNGSSWSSPARVTNSADSSNTNPKINLRIDHPFLVWERNRDIYYSEYVSSSWTPPQTITTNAASDSLPEIAGNTSYQPTGVWVYWQSNRDGNWEIYRTGLDTFTVNRRVTNNNFDDVSPCPINGIAPIRFSDALLVAMSSNRYGNFDILNKFYWNDSLYTVDTNHAQDIHPVTTADFHAFIWILWQTDRNVDWDICGSFYLAGGAAEEGLVTKPVACRSFPNPFRDQTTIYLSFVPNAENRELRIYDPSGRLVRSFSLRNTLYAIRWSGTDQSGRPVPPGVYFVRTDAGSGTIQEKIVRLR